jgi:hypothetical protein
MSDRPTAETDDLLNTIRKVECELAEAVKARDHNRTCIKRLTQERDEAREQIAKANSERENDTQAELAAWELLRDTRELARELRDALDYTLDYILGDSASYLPNTAIERAHLTLTKAKEVLP